LFGDFTLQHELKFGLFNSRQILVVLNLIGFVILSLSCQKKTATSFETPPNIESMKEIPKDWQEIETNYFSFSIPPMMKRTYLRGTDSQMMGFENDEIYLELDYGIYSTKIESSRFEQKKEQILIDGKKTTLISFDENKLDKDISKRFGTKEKHFIAGVNFPHDSEMIAKGFRFTASFIASCATLESKETAKTILQSIKFKKR